MIFSIYILEFFASVPINLLVPINIVSGRSVLSLKVKHGIFKQVSTRIELPDGSKQYSKTINNNPEKYFTQDILDKLEPIVAKEFLYGAKEEVEEVDED